MGPPVSAAADESLNSGCNERSRRTIAENAEKNLISLKKRIAGLSESTLERFARRARHALRMKGTVDVLVTTRREMQGLNRRFRSKNAPTDVLSFPAMREPGSARRFTGDVAICAEIACKNADRLGHSPADEVKILALHGMLHLAGYDHESDNGRMARKEMKLRRELGLPTGLLERTEKERSEQEIRNEKVFVNRHQASRSLALPERQR